ncbi:MAG: 30S ribosomal protein S3 [Candidatus Dormibacteria bacterium]
MGQKVNPIGFRLGVYRQWDARWFADKEYTKLLHEDLAMRRLIASRLRNAGVARIETERSANQLTVIIQTAKPGIVIGKQGASVDALRDELERISGKKVRVTIHEIKTPELDARLVAENVASQLEKRIAFRRALKQTVMRSMRAGAKGVKLEVSGRLGGAEMSRREWDRDGRVPLHTLRANIDFGRAEARTTFGRIGVTCWIYKGDYVTATGEPVMIGGPGREVVEAARPAAAIERERRPLAAPAVPDREEVPAALAGAGDGGGLDVETDLAGPSGAGAAEAPQVEADLDLEAAEPEITEADEELPDLGVVPEADAKVEKLPAKKPAARRRPAPAKKPALGAEAETEAEED